MPCYAILANPGHNRVYFGESLRLSIKELELAATRAGTEIANIRYEMICGVWYILFDTARELEPVELRIIGEMSFAYAAFIKKGSDFLPIETLQPGYMNGEMNTILKYSGKTNELFTRLMVNMALYSSRFYDEGRISLFDPLCGRGTTLFEGLMRGYDVIGVEALTNPAHEAEVFLTRYLKENRYIHKVFHEKRSDSNGKKVADCTKILLAPTREAFADDPRNFTLYTADTLKSASFIKRASVHLLVTDLPYGVQHGSRNNRQLTRNPTELLSDALPIWSTLMKPGGAMAVAYNVNVTPRKKICDVFNKFGAKVQDIDMTHRVDQSILRDVVLAINDA